MRPTTNGTFRVHPSDRDDDELVLLDPETGDAYYVSRDPDAGTMEAETEEARPARSDAGETVADLHPGYLVEATLTWDDDTPRVTDLTVRERTLYTFVDDAEVVFEAARDTWDRARGANEAMAADVTRDTDGRTNGVVYTFARQAGERDLFAEFRRGDRPLDPLLGRLASGDADPPFEAFVVRPADEPFVLICLTIDKGGGFAAAMRETYDCPAPAEVGVESDPTPDPGDVIDWDA